MTSKAPLHSDTSQWFAGTISSVIVIPFAGGIIATVRSVFVPLDQLDVRGKLIGLVQ